MGHKTQAAMTTLFADKSSHPQETRAAITPDIAKKLIDLGIDVHVETGIGLQSGFSDEEYTKAGAKLATDRAAASSQADIICRVRKPALDDLNAVKANALHISFLDPFNEQHLVETLASSDISSISLEMIPRTTLAQKMDALSSQANLAGYAAVIIAASRMKSILPMMMTPAGTISPARFFIVGVGVAGLQAIATAKRLGARVDAFDTRPVVEEQVKSLGAKFLKIDIGETGQTKQGYAKQLTPEQLKKQQDGMAKACSQSDVIITTAKLFGRRSPIIINQQMIEQMKPGSIIVDLAAEAGGNVEGTELGKEVVTPNGVIIIGKENIEGHFAKNASEMLAANFYSLIEHCWDNEQKKLKLNTDDEIVRGCLITHNGAIVNEQFKQQ